MRGSSDTRVNGVNETIVESEELTNDAQEEILIQITSDEPANGIQEKIKSKLCSQANKVIKTMKAIPLTQAMSSNIQQLKPMAPCEETVINIYEQENTQRPITDELVRNGVNLALLSSEETVKEINNPIVAIEENVSAIHRMATLLRQTHTSTKNKPETIYASEVTITEAGEKEKTLISTEEVFNGFPQTSNLLHPCEQTVIEIQEKQHPELPPQWFGNESVIGIEELSDFQFPTENADVANSELSNFQFPTENADVANQRCSESTAISFKDIYNPMFSSENCKVLTPELVNNIQPTDGNVPYYEETVRQFENNEHIQLLTEEIVDSAKIKALCESEEAVKKMHNIVMNLFSNEEAVIAIKEKAKTHFTTKERIIDIQRKVNILLPCDDDTALGPREKETVKLSTEDIVKGIQDKVKSLVVPNDETVSYMKERTNDFKNWAKSAFPNDKKKCMRVSEEVVKEMKKTALFMVPNEETVNTMHKKAKYFNDKLFTAFPNENNVNDMKERPTSSKDIPIILIDNNVNDMNKKSKYFNDTLLAALPSFKFPDENNVNDIKEIATSSKHLPTIIINSSVNDVSGNSKYFNGRVVSALRSNETVNTIKEKASDLKDKAMALLPIEDVNDIKEKAKNAKNKVVLAHRDTVSDMKGEAKDSKVNTSKIEDNVNDIKEKANTLKDKVILAHRDTVSDMKDEAKDLKVRTVSALPNNETVNEMIENTIDLKAKSVATRSYTDLVNNIKETATDLKERVASSLPNEDTVNTVKEKANEFKDMAVSSLPNEDTVNDIKEKANDLKDRAISSLPNEDTVNTMKEKANELKDIAVSSLPNEDTVNTMKDKATDLKDRTVASLPLHEDSLDAAKEKAKDLKDRALSVFQKK